MDAVNDIERQREEDYERRQKCEKSINDYYEFSYKEQNRFPEHKESEYPDPRSLPEFKSADTLYERRETPGFVSWKPSFVQEMKRWNGEVARHTTVEADIAKGIAREMKEHFDAISRLSSDQKAATYENAIFLHNMQVWNNRLRTETLRHQNFLKKYLGR